MPYLVGVRRRRQATGVKVGAFIEPLNCSRSHYMSVENRSRPASIELAHQIAARLTELTGKRVEAKDLLPRAKKDPEPKKGPGTVPEEPPVQPRQSPKSPRRGNDPSGPPRVDDRSRGAA